MNHSLLDQLKVFILIFDPESLILEYMNQSAQRAFKHNMSNDSVHFSTFNTLFPETQLSRLLKRHQRGRVCDFVQEYEIEGSPISICFVFKILDDGTYLIEGSDHSAARETELMLKSYSEVIEKKNKLIQREQRKVERLLFNTLPEACVNQLRDHGQTQPEKFTEVSVLFLDFVGFTDLSTRMSTDTLFRELNDIFTQFDNIIIQHRCERIKTIGDAYLAVCGMPKRIERHASLLSLAAYRMREYIQQRNDKSQFSWRCRIGIHTGEVTGGVVGRLKYIYDIFGDGVNTASRMESHSEEMKINLSKSTRSLLSDEFTIHPRGLIKVKGKGEMQMFYLEDIKGFPCSDLIQTDVVLPSQDSLDDFL